MCIIVNLFNLYADDSVAMRNVVAFENVSNDNEDNQEYLAEDVNHEKRIVIKIDNRLPNSEQLTGA